MSVQSNRFLNSARSVSSAQTASTSAAVTMRGGASAAQVSQAASLALRTGLAGSVGSDFHDPRVPWNPPGRLAKLPGAVPAVWSVPAFPIALPEVA